MSVDLGDLILPLKYQVSPPGQDLFPDVSNNEWVTRLENGFWSARLDGLFTNYRAADGLIEPTSGTTDLGRDLQQLVILYTAMDIVLAELRNAQTNFRAKAGPVEFEQSRSAPLLREVLMAIRGRIKDVAELLSAVGAVDTCIHDAVIARTLAIDAGEIWWVR